MPQAQNGLSPTVGLLNVGSRHSGGRLQDDPWGKAALRVALLVRCDIGLASILGPGDVVIVGLA